jgi:5-methylcytosine-specific restriction endonuclease McrA
MKYKRSVNKEWRETNGEGIRRYYRAYYAKHRKHRERAAAARQRRFAERPGLASYLTSLRREREQVQRCTCCSNDDFRIAYLRYAGKGLETDHKVSLAIAIETGLQEMHCVSNLQGLTPKLHKIKTSVDISTLAEIRRRKNVAYHKRKKR